MLVMVSKRILLAYLLLHQVHILEAVLNAQNKTIKTFLNSTTVMVFNWNLYKNALDQDMENV